jgi:Xaa-Pro aminopeptidase
MPARPAAWRLTLYPRAVASVLLYGDTARYPALRHEIPLDIVDELLFVDTGEEKFVLTSSLEAARIEKVLPDVRLSLYDELGLFELVKEGMRRDLAELEVAIRALTTWGIEDVVVPHDLPVAVADRIRVAGIALTVDGPAVAHRRRVKTPLELGGIRRAQRAAEAGMAVGEALIRHSSDRDGILFHDGRPLTAEIVRDAIRAACAAAGAPAPPDIMVVSLLSGGGHDPGAGPLPAGLPIEIDLWPRDEETSCWADMTRTFVGGEVNAKTADMRDIGREALEAARGAARPGADGRELYDAACDVFERAGYPTRRSAGAGEVLTHGFYFALGHGLGLEVHEPPHLGLGTGDELVPGDVIAIEPGLSAIEEVGGVRFEDLLLITEHGSETLTQYPYDL